MFCRKCGKELPDDSAFCPKCGEKISFGVENEKTNIEILTAEEKQHSLQPKQNPEIEHYDIHDFVTNDSLFSGDLHILCISNFDKTFHRLLEYINLALASCRLDERQSKAEEYYARLLSKIESLIRNHADKFESTPTRDLLGFNPRNKFANENAHDDIALYVSLCELSRIPYLSDGFLDKKTEAIINSYHTNMSLYQICVQGKVIKNNKIYGDYFSFKQCYFAELQKNYPDYMQRSSKVTEIQTRKEGCYIATAVYGNYNALPVLKLRFYRDHVLRRNIFGRMFIKVYYALSPSMAKKMKGKEKFNGAVRKLLDRFVKKIDEKYMN